MRPMKTKVHRVKCYHSGGVTVHMIEATSPADALRVIGEIGVCNPTFGRPFKYQYVGLATEEMLTSMGKPGGIRGRIWKRGDEFHDITPPPFVARKHTDGEYNCNL